LVVSQIGSTELHLTWDPIDQEDRDFYRWNVAEPSNGNWGKTAYFLDPIDAV
jgi:hypothetical protein